MPGGGELKRLELRRRELVLQSAMNRLAIRGEVRNLRSALQPAERIVSSVRAARPWLTLLVPLAGILLARKVRNNGSGFSRLLGVLRLIQPVLGLWKQFAASAAPESQAAPEARTRDIER